MDRSSKILHYLIMPLRFPGWQRFADVLIVAIYEHPPGWLWRAMPTDYYNIWLVLEGRGTIETAGQTWPFAPGSVFVFPEDACPVGHAMKGSRMTNFTMHVRTRGRASRLFQQVSSEVGPGPTSLRNFLLISHLCRHLSDLFYLDDPGSRSLVLSGLDFLLQTLLRDHQAPPANPSRKALLEAIGRIRRNPAASYTLSELASAAGLSIAHFNRQFKALTGLTPNRFLIEERIARAETYLRETTLSVQEIADRLGYRDVYFFSRQFRRFRGVPPTTVRKNLAL